MRCAVDLTPQLITNSGTNWSDLPCPHINPVRVFLITVAATGTSPHHHPCNMALVLLEGTAATVFSGLTWFYKMKGLSFSHQEALDKVSIAWSVKEQLR